MCVCMFRTPWWCGCGRAPGAITADVCRRTGVRAFDAALVAWCDARRGPFLPGSYRAPPASLWRCSARIRGRSTCRGPARRECARLGSPPSRQLRTPAGGGPLDFRAANVIDVQDPRVRWVRGHLKLWGGMEVRRIVVLVRPCATSNGASRTHSTKTKHQRKHLACKKTTNS